jgi:hypothetical protein
VSNRAHEPSRSPAPLRYLAVLQLLVAPAGADVEICMASLAPAGSAWAKTMTESSTAHAMLGVGVVMIPIPDEAQMRLVAAGKQVWQRLAGKLYSQELQGRVIQAVPEAP